MLGLRPNSAFCQTQYCTKDSRANDSNIKSQKWNLSRVLTTLPVSVMLLESVVYDLSFHFVEEAHKQEVSEEDNLGTLSPTTTTA